MTRADGRAFDQLRPVELTKDYIKFAEGSVLIRCGDTVVLCNASVEEKTPPHVPEGHGWVTAEYSMLPRANRERSRRDIDKLKLSGRSAEMFCRETAAPVPPPLPAALWPWPWPAGS